MVLCALGGREFGCCKWKILYVFTRYISSKEQPKLDIVFFFFGFLLRLNGYLYSTQHYLTNKEILTMFFMLETLSL